MTIEQIIFSYVNELNNNEQLGIVFGRLSLGIYMD